MAWLRRLLPKSLSPPDFNSIRFRLTAGVVLVSTLGISGVAGWMNWRMQHLLLEGHLQSVEYLSQRFNEDVGLYQETMTTEESLQKVIDHRAMGDTAIWVRTLEGRSLAQSETLSMGSWQEAGLTQYLRTLPADEVLEIRPVGDRYLVIRINPLVIAGETVGTLFVVEDITESQ
ncbi:MAG: sensor histidine kinase, partial [Cyanobacteria bacterium P01_H01_bin.58]